MHYHKNSITAKHMAKKENTTMKTDLTAIPYVGKKSKQSLNNIGIEYVEDLVGKDPEALYIKDCLAKGFQEDRCQLYLFRMAVYFAEHKHYEEEKLKWWYWKDKKYPIKSEEI